MNSSLKAGPLQEVSIADSNAQKEFGSKSSASNTLAVRKSQGSCNRQGGYKRDSEMLFPGKPNETILMKTRPATSFAFKARQHASSQQSTDKNVLGPSLKMPPQL